ncbi:MAG: hypothetical protein K2W91_03325 [Novosphingobium sp.]|nr:hypothetical protein [Novosphingobium sp.]
MNNIPTDVATWLDPAVFSIGFCFAAAGITLTQIFRDDIAAGSPVGLQESTSFIFGMTRKVTAMQIACGVILGFWIVGWWWIVLGLTMVILGAVIVNVVMIRNRALWPVYALCASGVGLMIWAQSPLLRYWGILNWLS